MDKRYIWVTFRKEGIHKYPGAVDLPGVEFLANEHRHIFHFRIELQVWHDDREVEFILFKAQIIMIRRAYTCLSLKSNTGSSGS